MLVQLLSAPHLQNHLLHYLPNLSRAAYALDQSAFELSDVARGWASGHHPQISGPESWSTASVFHFAHVLGRLLAEAIRSWTFDHLEVTYSPPRDQVGGRKEFGPNLLDSDLAGYGSLKQTLLTTFVEPIAQAAHQVKAGRRFPPETPMSAIFFGPPGTSKTDLAELISKYLGWPLLPVDPSYFVRHGLDQVQSQASQLFRLLSVAEQIVVLLDEFDEMVRDRSVATDVLSRFLTTAMLPKLGVLNRRRRIVFIVATNYINNFDLAISRQGRFDLVLQVMPPKLEEKRAKWPKVALKLDELHLSGDPNLRTILNDLTFLEFKALAARLDRLDSGDDVREAVTKAHENSTLNSRISGEEPPRNWKDASEEQKRRIRLPQP